MLGTLNALKTELVEEKDSIDVSPLIEKLLNLHNSVEAGPEQAQVIAETAAVSEVEAEKEGMDDVFLNDTEEKVLRAAIQEGYKGYHIVVELDPECVMKSVRAYIVFNNLKDLGDVLKTIPSTEEIEEEKFELQFEIVLLSRDKQEKIRSLIKSVNEVKEVRIRCLSLKDGAAENGAEQVTFAAAGEETKEHAKAETTEKKSVSQTVRWMWGGWTT